MSWALQCPPYIRFAGHTLESNLPPKCGYGLTPEFFWSWFIKPIPQNSSYVACCPFDASAQGTMFNNGVGLVVLKRLEDAIASMM
ncbi:beta-ketoacyl synthase N-terminal-like domain-containing protein [Nostoc sp.]|uniref:beta-ketoacyl synthase N-terminal-like domain-containing protein n=1 Tax=Nostoc sp. TaxID=1180 RepID=UPI002FF9B6F9